MEAVIFDMDGVLVDSEGFWQEAEQEVFSSLGVTLEADLCALTRSMSTREVTKFWYDRCPWQGNTLDEVEHLVISKVIDCILHENCEINGISGFIEALKSKGFKIGLATNSPDRIIPEVLQKLNISHLFDTVSSAEYEQEAKPHPAVYLSTARKLGVSPSRCVVIEDSNSGIAAAKQAGMTAIAYTAGDDVLHFPKADYTISDFGKVDLKILEKATSSTP